MSNTFTTKLTEQQISQLKRDLKEQDFTLSNGPHMHFCAKKTGICINVYLSGKVVVQGKSKDEWMEFYFEPTILQSFVYTNKQAYEDFSPRIGSDEAGKGDFFGPLCVCSVFANEKGVQKLLDLGITDSKKISDKKILTLAPQIKKCTRYSAVCIYPEKYNSLYEKFHNLNYMLAWAHYKAIEAVVKDTRCKKVTVDKFASPTLIETHFKKANIQLDLLQVPRAESDIVVAAASVLAREAFLKGLEKLEEEHQISLPKGASSLVKQAGIKIGRESGVDVLEKVSKKHFKTFQEVINSL